VFGRWVIATWVRVLLEFIGAAVASPPILGSRPREEMEDHKSCRVIGGQEDGKLDGYVLTEARCRPGLRDVLPCPWYTADPPASDFA